MTLRAAIIGAGPFGQTVLAALRQIEAVELVGLADRDASAAARLAESSGCPAFGDNRQLLSQTKPQAVFLAVPPAASAELARLAIDRGCDVWAGMPIAPTLAEAVALCRQAEAAGRKLAVGAYRRYMPGYAQARANLARLGRLYLLEAHYLFDWGGSLGWRGDRSAGGGALAELGSHALDLAVWLLGLPENVYCLTGTTQRPRGQSQPAQPIYDTDDSAVLTLRYPGRAVATAAVSRTLAPFHEGLTIYGAEGSIACAPGRCSLCDRQGAVLQSGQEELPAAGVLARQIAAFIATGGLFGGYDCSGWENLLVQACVEAAYLSDRTGQPESPAAILAGYNVSADDCRKYVPITNH